jgi:hypothetical protein
VAVKLPCPISALPSIADQLRGFGCNVHFDTAESGRVTHDAGAIRFWHRDGTLHIEILQNEGHFPHAMLIGGIRQIVQETVEQL